MASETEPAQASEPRIRYANLNPLAAPHKAPALLLLPETVLELILLATGRPGELRYVCKAFSLCISKSIKSLKVPRNVLRDSGSLLRALEAFTNSRHVVLDLSRRKEPTLDSIVSDEDADDDLSLVAGALDTVATLRHPLMSLAVLHLSCPLPLLSGATMGYLASCGLIELKLQDVSIQRSASDGASNLLRSPFHAQPPGQLSLADSIRARGEAMARFARCLPSLRRLSLCNAAFSTADVASLAALTQLEELSLDGAMEYGGGGGDEAAAAAYKPLLGCLKRLRRLRLPMAISPSSRQELMDSDDEDDIHGNGGFQEQAGFSGNIHGRLAAASSNGWSFPPGLQELIIPLCSLNGPVFRAVCDAYGNSGEWPTGDGGCWGGIGGGCVGPESTRNLEKVSGLRSLHIICAPGYTVWEGSFLGSDRDFCFLSRLGPSLESLHLSLELQGSGRGALRRSQLRGCFTHLRKLAGLKALEISQTVQPVCFAVRKSPVCHPDLMSYLLYDERGAPYLCADPLLPRLPRLGGPPRNGGRHWPGPGTGGGNRAAPGPAFIDSPWPSSSSASASCLDFVLSYWPKMEMMVVGGQRVVRSSSGRGGGGGKEGLVLAGSLEEMMAAMDVDKGLEACQEPQTPPSSPPLRQRPPQQRQPEGPRASRTRLLFQG